MIYKYLLEIKYRICFSVIAWSFIMINCYYFKEILLYLFMKFSSNPNDIHLLFFLTTDVAEVFVAYIQLSFFIANQMTIICLGCHCFLFFSTGLYIFEYVYFKTIIIIVILYWLLFIFVLNNYIFPTSWYFFFKFQEYLSFQNLTFYFEAKLNEYLIFYKSLHSFGTIICQIIVVFCIILDLFKTNLLIVKKLRKLFYLIFFLVSTVLTPPEIIYQLISSICIIIIYELFTVYLFLKTELTDFKFM